MNCDSLLKQFNVCEEKRSYLRSMKIAEDFSLLKTLLTFADNCETQNPYYKFEEVLDRVEACDQVYIHDLETLDEYYKMNLVDRLLSDPMLSEYYTGGAFTQKRRLASYLKGQFSKFDYYNFRRFLSALS